MSLLRDEHEMHQRTDSKSRKMPTAERNLAQSERLLNIFNEMRGELLGTMWHLIGNTEDAQDAAQDTFLKCWRARQTLSEIENLRAWIFHVATNVARDYRGSAWFRRAKQFPKEENLLPSGALPAEQFVEEQEQRECLRRAICHLPQNEKEVFLLRQNGELTFEQIAAIRQSPVGTVKSQMRRALAKLRARLERERWKMT